MSVPPYCSSYWGILALLMRLQLAVPSNNFLSREIYKRIFTMYRHRDDVPVRWPRSRRLVFDIIGLRCVAIFRVAASRTKSAV
jgi:hypothetical protein